MTSSNILSKKFICFFLILSLIPGLLPGCGKDKKSDANTDDTETASADIKETDTDKAEAPDDGSDANSDDIPENISGTGILHPIIASKEIRLAKPNDSEAFSNIEWNTVSLSDEDAAKYPELAKALTDYSKEQDMAANTFSNDSKDQAVGYLDGIEAELYEDGQLTDYWYYDLEDWPYYMMFEYQNRLNITRCDETAFSVQEDYYDYEGGTHGYYACNGMNFDTKTGKELDVNDVVKDIDKLNDILHDKLMTEYDDLLLDDDTVWDDLKGRASGEYAYNWLLAHDRVTFYFNPYALTAFAGGMQVIDIQFSKYPDLFEEKYTKAPDEYVLHLGRNGEISLDIDGDGNVEKVRAEVIDRYDYYPEETDKGCSVISITIDDETDNFAMPDGYSGDTYFVHSKNGNYIYFISKVYDASYLMCIDVNDGYAKRVHRMCDFLPNIADVEYDGADLKYSMNESSVASYTEAFTDPSKFALQVPDLSGGISRYLYYVGSDGMPVRENERDKAAIAGKKSHTSAVNTDLLGTFWSGAYIEQLYDHIPENKKFTDIDPDKYIDLFICVDETAVLSIVDDNIYDDYSCKGSFKNDGRGGIIFEDCTDPYNYERDPYGSYLIPHIYPVNTEINGESGFLAMEFYDKCIYFRQDEMPDELY